MSSGANVHFALEEIKKAKGRKLRVVTLLGDHMNRHLTEERCVTRGRTEPLNARPRSHGRALFLRGPSGRLLFDLTPLRRFTIRCIHI
ncbi:MAG TPA: hypothetical protein P5567_07670 [Kiritimatiellia bacterium]|nr:hypothetical protein [Kiritimatiellia bacterium]HRZ12316.1 hypothetical protein [Kiritimatiellia bacterium]HSA17926.1 hypothetical protein [Kiritimatiellia bacterium]